MAEVLKKLNGRVQSVEGGKGIEGLNYEDLCIHPDVQLPEGYKPPKFKMFDGTGDPKVHLGTYCDKLVGVGRDEQIRMKLFMRSLNGDALSWYISQNPKKWVNWWINPNKICAYHSGMKGHTIDECRTLKDRIQTLIDNKVIQAEEVAPNICNNPLPYHRGKGVNVIETDEEWDPEGNALIKVLSEAYVPTNITSGEMANMVGQIHAVGAVASTMHQDVKFEWNHQEVIIHGDGSNPIYTNQTIPVIDNRKKLGGEIYHRIERVNTIEKDRWWSNKIESILIWTGYEPGKGFGKNLQGITKPVQPQRHGITFGLRYEYTRQEYEDWSPPWRGPYYPLEQPVPPLHQTFPQADIMWGSEEDEALAGMRKLFLDEEDMDCSAIVKEEEEEDLTIQTMGKGAILKNWTTALSRALFVFTIILYIFSFCNIVITYPDEPVTVTYNETTQHKDSDSEDLEDDTIPEEIVREVENFENKPKSNLDESEAVNLGYSELVKETHISIHLSPTEKEEYIRFLKEYEDIFAWSYDDMTGLSTSIVAHKLTTNPTCPPVKQKIRKFKPDMSLKIKEEVTKQIKAKVLRVVEYPTWLANIVLIPTKDGKIRVCVEYQDINKASPKDDFPLPNIHILIDNYAKQELKSFVDCFAGYHQIWMDEEDAEKTAFIMPWGVYCYKMIPFGLKNARATYMRAMTTIFHDMIHKEIEVYVDDVIIKSKRSTNHIADLRKFFDRLRSYNLKLNPAKCAFRVPTKKLLGFIISRRGIELDPSKTDERQKAFDKIKEYLSKPPILVPPDPGRSLLLYLSVLDGAFGCVLGQNDETGRKKQAIYYLSKKFTPYEALVLFAGTHMLFFDMDSSEGEASFLCIHYISHIEDGSTEIYLSEAHPTGKLAKWQILLSEFVIIYVTQKAVKGQALADHLAENPVSFVGEDITEAYDGCRVFFEGATNFKGVGIRVVLVSETGQHYSVSAKLKFPCTNNMAEYEACIFGLRLAIDMNVHELLVIGDSDLLVYQVLGEWSTKNTKILPYLHCVQELIKRFTKIEFKHVLRIQNEFADALSTLSSMIQHPNKNLIDPVPSGNHKQPACSSHVEEESD
ncbi:uncharacterized protein [Nicotiana tomentosiformis]|uniref:uncharacterized protein n=1 Tax=Nicotiana tomentosiformis TaxID=4098 RepID=UPI00388CE9D6